MYSAAVSTPSSKVSTETPSHLVRSFDHLVTQWMSVVISSEGSCWNSSHVHLLGSSTSPKTEKSHCSSGVRGVGPAERTGKPSTRYWPGGSAVSWPLRRPLKPLEKNRSPMLLTSSLSCPSPASRETPLICRVSPSPPARKLPPLYPPGASSPGLTT